MLGSAAVRPFGIYVHFPYCSHICPYCDFAVAVAARIPHERYAAAVVKELAARAALYAGREAVSLYFGGGTPSLWEPACVAHVIAAGRAHFGLGRAAEITLEANPESCDAARLRAYREVGVNRLSLGVQSFASPSLVALGRRHSGADAARAVSEARAAGFDNLSIDLIHGDTTQTVGDARADAARAVALSPEHISCYALTLTELAVPVPMARAWERGDLKFPDEETQAQMGAAVREELARGGIVRYEISNFAKEGRTAVHNALYWEGADVVQAGNGAVGLWRDPITPRGRRTINERAVGRYLEAIESGRTELAVATVEELDAEALLRERFLTGLRRVAGIDLALLEEELGLPARARHEKTIGSLVERGLASWNGQRLALTERGLDLHSEIALQFF